MHLSNDHIITTHVGSLPRTELLDARCERAAPCPSDPMTIPTVLEKGTTSELTAISTSEKRGVRIDL
jgi:hypothetical protein